MLLDHVVVAVPDLDTAVDRLRRDTGLAAAGGGPQPEWGTANRIVPLGSAFLELMAVADAAAAGRNPVGRRVQRVLAAGGGLAGWAVAVDDLDEVADRLGLRVGGGRRERADGTVYAWRAAGLGLAFGLGLPFFIAWEPGPGNPHAAAAPHAVTPDGFAWVEVGGDAEALREWLGPDALPVRPVRGASGPVRVAIATDAGEVVVPPGSGSR